MSTRVFVLAFRVARCKFKSCFNIGQMLTPSSSKYMTFSWEVLLQVMLVHYDGYAAASIRGVRIHKNARVKTWLAATVRAYNTGFIHHLPNLEGCGCDPSNPTPPTHTAQGAGRSAIPQLFYAAMAPVFRKLRVCCGRAAGTS